MNLEDRIRTAIKSGGLLSVSLYPSAVAPGMWICAYLNDSGKKRDSVMDRDPIEALIKGITPLRQAGEKVPEAFLLDATSETAVAKAKKLSRKKRRDDDVLGNSRRRDSDDVL